MRVILLVPAAGALGAAAYLLLTPPAPEALPSWNRPVLGYEILALMAAIVCVITGLALLRVALHRSRAKMLRGLRRFIISVVSSCLVVIALDIVLSLFPRLQYSFARTEDLWFCGHPYLVEDVNYGWRGRANAVVSYTFVPDRDGGLLPLVRRDRWVKSGEEPFSIRYSLDAEGFPNKDVPKRADVLILGDSFGAEGNEPAGKHWTERLRRELGCTVYNTSTQGWGPFQEYLALREYRLRMKPRMALWVFYEGNDLRDAGIYEEFRRFQAERGYRWADYLAHKGLASRQAFPYNRPTARLLLYVARQLNPAPAVDATGYNPLMIASGGRTRPQAIGVESYYQMLMPEEHIKTEYRNWNLTHILLEQAMEESKGMDIKFVLVYIPCKSRVYLPFVEDKESFYRFVEPTLPGNWRNGPDDLMNALRENSANVSNMIRKLCEERSVTFIDTTEALTRAAKEEEFPYYCYDMHFNEKGHEVVSEVILDALRREGLVPFESVGTD